MMLARELVEAARGLIGDGADQASLRRAASTLYYACFHALADTCAASLVGGITTPGTRVAWRHAYRALDHRVARAQCLSADVAQLGPGVRGFARIFVDLQGQRHLADYDPFATFDAARVAADLADTTLALDALASAPEADRRAFAALMLLRPRGT